MTTAPAPQQYSADFRARRPRVPTIVRLPITAAETPGLDTLADITAVSVERCAIPLRDLMVARIAALIAVDAPAASYLADAGAAAESGVTAEDIQSIMIGIAPVVGTPRVVAAAGNIVRALGFEIMVAEAEMEEAAGAEQ